MAGSHNWEHSMAACSLGNSDVRAEEMWSIRYALRNVDSVGSYWRLVTHG